MSCWNDSIPNTSICTALDFRHLIASPSLFSIRRRTRSTCPGPGVAAVAYQRPGPWARVLARVGPRADSEVRTRTGLPRPTEATESTSVEQRRIRTQQVFAKFRSQIRSPEPELGAKFRGLIVRS